MNIFDQGHRHRGLVTHVPDHRRNTVFARNLAGAPTALARYNFPTARGQGPDHYRLQHPVHPDTVSEFRQRLVIKIPARLELTPPKLL